MSYIYGMFNGHEVRILRAMWTYLAVSVSLIMLAFRIRQREGSHHPYDRLLLLQSAILVASVFQNCHG